jgi:hypothetical protein
VGLASPGQESTIPAAKRYQGIGAGRRHDIIEALLELVDNIVSRLGLQHSDE